MGFITTQRKVTLRRIVQYGKFGIHPSFMPFLFIGKTLTQRAHDVTSYQRRCDVITSHRRRYDVILAPNAHWVSLQHYTLYYCRLRRLNSFNHSTIGLSVSYTSKKKFKIFRRYYEFVSKFKVELKYIYFLLHQDLSEPDVDGDFVYKLRKNAIRADFSTSTEKLLYVTKVLGII